MTDFRWKNLSRTLKKIKLSNIIKILINIIMMIFSCKIKAKINKTFIRIFIKILSKIFNKNHMTFNNYSDKIKINQNSVFSSANTIIIKKQFCFKCSFSNYSIKNCKSFFNLNQIFVRNNKIKSQFYKTWVRKCIKIQILHINNFNNNNKSNHNVHIITDKNYKFNFNKSCKHLKN